MKILLLAPHPFFQDRGTPIAVDLLLKVFSERGDEVDLLTYHEGRDVVYDHVRIYRIVSLPWIRGIRPGYSFKKMVCDVLMFFKTLRMLMKKRYDVIHAVEESAFIAMVLKWFFGVPYVYDVDSSLPQQLVERYPMLRIVKGLMNLFEWMVVRQAAVVVVVCDALLKVVQKYNPNKLAVLYDVPLLKDGMVEGLRSLRDELKLSGFILMYVGNLEGYQGIDLLIESFVPVVREVPACNLVIIGGAVEDVQRYRRKSIQLGIQDPVHFLGAKPIELLSFYLGQADILLSPRTKGKNTPMKLYSYLASGRPIVATDLETHTQVLDDQTAVLAAPLPEAFAAGILRLLKDELLRNSIGATGKKLIEEKYSFNAYRKRLNEIYDGFKKQAGA